MKIGEVFVKPGDSALQYYYFIIMSGTKSFDRVKIYYKGRKGENKRERKGILINRKLT